jgi:NADP-dependent aldehyde dehydrogenase
MPKLLGRSIIGWQSGRGTNQAFCAVNPSSGETLAPDFFSATPEELSRAVELAQRAFAVYGRISGRDKGRFLRKIALRMESIAEQLVERAGLETALPKARLESELARTANQLGLFAQVVEEGSWVMARIDRADPARQPLAKPDIRSWLRPLGPIAIFGASNFPLAFSVAGGDTASALAAGNPVIVKGHPAHPGTSELVGQAITDAIRESGLPEGVFSLLFDRGTQIGVALVQHPLVKAVGFTGSRKAGRALMDMAASRPEPIPFFGEMSSTNPVFVLPEALRRHLDKIASGLYTSFTVGAGQFCTKPGIVVLPEGTDAGTFRDRLRGLVETSAAFTLLTSGIRSSYGSSVANRQTTDAVTVVAGNPASAPGTGFGAGAVLFETDAQGFLNHPDLAAEIFGPSTLLVRHSTRDELRAVAEHLEGHLTATIHGTDQDLSDFQDLLSILENKVGRLIFNGFPTGVEVCHAMVHGGPYPSSSDGRSTSVGSAAIFRFCRPICYQGFPDSALPPELQNDNPLGIWRMVDGQLNKRPLPEGRS